MFRLLLITCFICLQVAAQTDTEVYLFDLKTSGDAITLENKRNISSNVGYDNQPSFYDDNKVLFAKTINGQTDIASYSINDNTTQWVSNTKQGSEYSPLKIPNQQAVSAIRLDTTGLQRLYRYDYNSGVSSALLDTLVVGYHSWYDEETIVSSVLAEGRLDLYVSHLNDKNNIRQQKNTGRSLHNIPNTDLVSFVSKEDKQWKIKSLQPLSGATQEIIDLPSGYEDYCWLHDGTIVLSKGNALYQYNAARDENWKLMRRFTDNNIWNITRVATNAMGTMLVIVSDVSPELIVEKQLVSFNDENLDAFANTFTRDVIVQNYPDELIYEGRDTLKKRYADLFAKGEKVSVEVKNRLVQGNKVIDEEWVTKNNVVTKQLTIFEIRGGLISKMTFINN